MPATCIFRLNPIVTQTLLSDASLGQLGPSELSASKNRKESPCVSEEQSSRYRHVSVARCHEDGLGHRVISITNCVFSSNNDCFKLTPSISHLSVYFLLGTFVSSDDDFKTVTIQRHILHTGKQRLRWVDEPTVLYLPGAARSPFVSQAGPQNPSTSLPTTQSSLFLYTSHTSIYLTHFPKPLPCIFKEESFISCHKEAKVPK